MCCSILVYPSIKSGLYFESFYLVVAFSSVKIRMISRQKSRSIYTMFAVTTCARDSHVYTRQSLEAVTIRNVILISTQESIRFLVYMIRVYTRYDDVLNVKIVNDLNSMNQGSYHIQSNIDTQHPSPSTELLSIQFDNKTKEIMVSKNLKRVSISKFSALFPSPSYLMT